MARRACINASRLVTLSAVVLMLGAGATPGPAPIATAFDADGYSALGVLDPANCFVGANIDLAVMISKAPELQARGVIAPSKSPAHVAAHAWTTASAMALKLQPFLIASIYEAHPALDRCAFVVTITGADGKQEGAFAFDMNRALSAKMKQAAASPQEFPSLTQNFRLGGGVTAHMNAENAP